MAEIVLSGLDGTNPIGFMAALGVLQICTDAGVRARLGWRLIDTWQPVLTGVGADPDELLALVADDLEAWRKDAPELSLCYEKKGKVVHDLRPIPEEFQGIRTRCSNRRTAGSSTLGRFRSRICGGARKSRC